MGDRIGNAALLWSATSDPNSERVHLLQVPLRAIKAGHAMETFTRESLDKSVIERTAIGDGAPELSGLVRYDHDPEGLMDVIVAGSQGRPLTYIPDLTDPDVKFTCDLIAPLTPAMLRLDQQRGILGDQSVELQLRLTTQGPFDPLYHGTAVLFSYRAGGSLEQSSSFGRITNSTAPATYPSNAGGGGYGTLITAASNEARIAWFAEDSSVGPRTFPALLLEDKSDQILTESEDFGLWTTGQGTPTRSSGQVDPYGGTEAWLIGDDNAAGQEFIELDSTLTTSAQLWGSLFIKEGLAPPTTLSLMTVKSSDGTAVLTIEFTWSSGEPVIGAVVGATGANPERWRNEFWRIEQGSSIAVSTGVYTYRIFPANVSTDVGNLFVFGANLEA